MFQLCCPLALVISHDRTYCQQFMSTVRSSAKDVAVTESADGGTSGLPLPSGDVSLLFTDVEGSTRLWAEDSDAMSASLRLHDEVLRDAVESRGGYVFATAASDLEAHMVRLARP